MADSNTNHHKHPPSSGNSTQHHHHQKIAVPSGEPIPAVKLSVYPDAKKGWNLEAKVTNFKFAPERVNTNPKMGEGHAHIFLNGKKLTRLYSSWYYIGQLPPGKHRITVTLNANNHADFTHDGKAIQDTVTLEVKRRQGAEGRRQKAGGRRQVDAVAASRRVAEGRSNK